MIFLLRCNYKQWFLNYVNKYGDEPEIRLKRDHSLRVANNMLVLFTDLSLPQDYISLADFIGLYHDIGRFEQWKTYHTFYDSVSVDHADYSADNLLSGGILNKIGVNKSYYDLIYKVIKYHNKLDIPDKLKIKEENMFINTPDLLQTLTNKELDKYNYDSLISLYALSIRDIDKIDILFQYILSNYFIKTDYLPVTDKVACDFFDNKSIDKNIRKNLNDTVVLRLSFINDINLTKSLELIKNSQILDEIYTLYPDKNNLIDFFKYAKSRLNWLIDANKNYQYVLKK